MAEETKPRIWLVVLLSTVSVAAVGGLFLADWRPWYTSEEKARLEQLRNEIEGLKGKSIAQYLNDNPAEKTQPFFYKPPVEYWTLDRFMARCAVVSSLWLVAMVPVGFYGALQFDKARAERQRLQALERQRLEAIERQRLEAIEMANAIEITDADVVGRVTNDNLKCAYCGRVIIANGVAAGQAMHCPNCGADVRVPRL